MYLYAIIDVYSRFIVGWNSAGLGAGRCCFWSDCVLVPHLPDQRSTRS